MSNSVVVLKDVEKSYNGFKALKSINVEFEEGKVTGFLGLNGAGKTTTMKIITTYITPNKGEVFVNNFNAITNPYSVRNIIGYLPENFPIYENLSVFDFLSFVCLSKDINDVETEVNRVIGLVGLERYKNSFLRSLSKGYKQRVGLAQAIIGDPKVIILDEPTQGLDPAQIKEIRHLIKDLAKNRTVILSTHIMQEVETVCDNIVIIHQGEIKLASSLEKLTKEIQDKIKVEYIFNFSFDQNIKEKLNSLLKKTNFDYVIENSSVFIEVSKEDEQKLVDLNKNLINEGLYFTYVNRKVLSMEDLFLKIIGYQG
jgi:ABC-2 type transport system ATP-binding protein